MTAAQSNQAYQQRLTPAEQAVVAAIAAYLASRATLRPVRLPAALVGRLVGLGLSRRAVRAATRLTLAGPAPGRIHAGVPTPAVTTPLVGAARRGVVTPDTTRRALALVHTAKRLTAAATPRPAITTATAPHAVPLPATPARKQLPAAPARRLTLVSTPTVDKPSRKPPNPLSPTITPEQGLRSPELSVVTELATYFASPDAVDAGVLPVELSNRLESLGLSKRAIRIAARLVLEPPLTGRNRWGSPDKAAPGADVSAVRRVAGDEPTWRARYLLAAATRLTDAEQFTAALAKERRYLAMHRTAGINRRAGAARVDAVAERAHGWLVWVGGTCDECRPLDGQVFRVGAMPLPPRHEHCHCGVRAL